MQTNLKVKPDPVFTHEGARAVNINYEQQLKRSVMACMLFEDNFYEDGVSIAHRITSLVEKVAPMTAVETALAARIDMKLRHVPLLIARAMARLPEHKKYVSHLLPAIIQRPDELTEFLSLYWKDNGGKRTLAAQVKKGLAKAFIKFDEYALAKYNRDNPVKLRDALFLSHANPLGHKDGKVYPYNKDARKAKIKYKLTEKEDLFRRLVDGELQTPDTWEVNLSGGANKKETFERLMAENKLGALAFIRNLRNMAQEGVQYETVKAYAENLKVDRVLPFRFITAARYVPQWENILEPLMFRCLEGQEKLPGKTVGLIDVSGSMKDKISEKSDTTRMDAAMGLAVLMRELCDDVEILTFSNNIVRVAPRRGFALRDAIKNSQPHSGTYLEQAVGAINAQVLHDRLIVFTDEQAHDGAGKPKLGTKGYMINVATNRNGVGYGAWSHIDGFSEAILGYIAALEKE